MAEPQKQSSTELLSRLRASRRSRVPELQRQQIVAEPDAVNETLRASGALQRMEHQRMQAQIQQQQKEAQERQRVQARTSYRKRKAAQQQQAKQSGQPAAIFELPAKWMSDEAVDAAIAQEQREAQFRASQPQLSQGYDRPKIDTERLADQYATVSNFYAALGSPNMMPMNTAQVKANPYVATQQLDFGLNNPALTTLQIATPTGPGTGAFGAAKTAFQTGMLATKPLVARTVAATGQAARAGGRALAQNAPRLAGNAIVLGVPASASAAVTAGDGGETSGSYAPAIFGTLATAVGGYGLYKGYGTLKRAGWNLQALSPTSKGAAIRAASRAPQATSTALVPYVGTYQRPGFFESWWETPKKSAATAGLPVPTRGQIWGARGRNYLRATGYGIGAGTLLDLGMSGASGEPFQWKAGHLPIALPENIIKGGYNALRGWYYPNAGTTTTQPTDSVTMQSQQTVNPTDTVVPVPRFDEAPVTTSTQAELDSINNAWFNGQSIE